MATSTGTAGNDSWTIINPGSYVLDGLGGTDTVSLGTSLRSNYTLTLASDGGVEIDTVSGASETLHISAYNIEKLVFNNGRDVLDVAAYFGDKTPPTFSFSDDVAGTARGNISFTLSFSEAVSGLSASDFLVGNGSVQSVVANSTSRYTVVVAPAANTEGSLTLLLNAGAVNDTAGNPNAEASAPVQAIDTKPPATTAFSPANGATGVAVDANIVISFSEAMQRGSGTLVLKDGSGATVAQYAAASSSNLSISGSVLTINPTSNLQAGMPYTLSVDAGSLQDTAGNPLAGVAGYSFTTAVDLANPKLNGGAGNDSFNAPATSMGFNGNAGLDSVLFAQARSAYALTPSSNGFVLATAGNASRYELSSIERLRFSDSKLALDLDGNAGKVAKLIGAVYGAAAAKIPEYVGIGLQLADGGTSYEGLAQIAIDARLGFGASNSAIVALLYTNVVGVAPSASELAFYVGLLDSHAYTPASLTVLAADTSLNQAHIDLAGLAQTGLLFT